MRTEGGDRIAVPRRRNFIGAAVRNALGRRLRDADRAFESGPVPVHVRRFCSASDSAACIEIYYRTRRETFVWLPRTRFRRSDFLVDTFEEELIVAEQDGKVIAFAGVYLPDDFLHHLYVAREYQGRGIGSALLQHLLDRSEGALRLKCLRRNERALAFYRRRGWREGEHGRDEFGEWVMLYGPAPAPAP
ncbi:MAG: GNAT family N-acetyltransferase [Verrucomicrobia bacterium]|nr:GNAT family N-acetyltransferase [Verrucomicrobiota bacterium]